MKRRLWLFGCLLWLASVVPVFGAYDTINTLPTGNASFISDLQTFLRQELPDYGFRQRGSSVLSGGYGATSANLTHTISAVTAFVDGHYTYNAAVSRTYTNTTRTYVFLRADSAASITIPGAAITYNDNFVFAEMAAGAAQPATPSGTIPLMLVDAAGAAITAVTDYRVCVAPVEYYGDLATAITTVGTMPAHLYVTKRAALSASVTVPNNVLLEIKPGAVLTTTGYTLNVAHLAMTGMHQMFAGTGTVIITGGLREIYPQTFGALADGSNDDSTAINQAIAAAYASSKQTGSAFRARVFFPAGAYMCKSTLIFKPFVNYEGVRATVSDTADVVTFTTGSGTVIRQHPDLYNNDNASAGVLVYIETGDMQISNMTFVGTGAINGNPSKGIQFGYSDGTRTHEVSDQVTSGINCYNLTFYTFLTAWEIYNLNDSRSFNLRMEVNTIGIHVIGKTPGTYMGDVEFYGAIIFASTHSFYLGDYANGDFSFHGGLFQGSASGAQNHVAKVAGTFPQTVSSKSPSYRFHGTAFKQVHASSKHINLDAIWDGFEGYFLFEGCTFENGSTSAGITLQRNGGTANANHVNFNNCMFRNTAIALNIANNIRINGGVFDNSYITAATTVWLDVQNATFRHASGSAVTAISSTTANCYDWSIQNNTFDTATVTTPVSVFNHSSNIDLIVKNNRGLMAHTPIAAGATSFDTRGKSHHFATTNVAPTTLSAITGAYDGQQIAIFFGDAQTTVDFSGTNLKGNAGVDLVAAVYDSILCTYYKAATTWYCLVQKGT